VTNDIAIALRTPTKDAEDLKIRFACALTKLANSEESIEVPSVGERAPRRLTRQTLAEVVEPRYEEVFTLVNEELERSKFKDCIGAGVVLTGGGSKLDGVIDLAEEIFNVPVRIAVPQYVSGLVDVVRNPIYSTGVGLLLFGYDAKNSPTQTSRFESNDSVFLRMKNWFQSVF